MQRTCFPNDIIKYPIDMSLHMTILFTILSLLFIFYVSGLIKQKMNAQLDTLIRSNISDALSNISEENQTDLKKLLKDAPLSGFDKLFSRPSKTVETYNSWLNTYIISVIIFLILFNIATISIAYISCNPINLGHMLIMNAITFSLVGLCEFLFFRFITLKYIPTPPSLMIRSIIQSIRDNL